MQCNRDSVVKSEKSLSLDAIHMRFPQKMSEQSQQDLLQTQSQDDEQARNRLNCHEERCNRRRIHTHFLKDRNAGGPELLGLYAREAKTKPHLEQHNLGELTTAEHKVLIETCDSGNNHRSTIVGPNLAASRSVMTQNFSRPTWKHFLEFGINL